MNKRISVKTRVLIILLAIFVFLVAALSVSICMFVKADNVAAQAERLERVVRETDSLGEVLKASDGRHESRGGAFAGAPRSGGIRKLYNTILYGKV